jgi:hypothetical protein
MLVLSVFLYLTLHLCPNSTDTFALTLQTGDTVNGCTLIGCNDSYTGGIYAPGGNITVTNTTIIGYGVGIVTGSYVNAPYTTGSRIINNTIMLTGNPDPNYAEREGWGDGILVFDDGALVLDNRVSMTGYGRVGIVWDHAWAPYGPVPYGTYPSWAHGNSVSGRFISCYHIEDFWGVNIDSSNTHDSLCGRRCFMWNDTLSRCDSSMITQSVTLPVSHTPCSGTLARHISFLWLVSVLLTNVG